MRIQKQPVQKHNSPAPLFFSSRMRKKRTAFAALVLCMLLLTGCKAETAVPTATPDLGPGQTQTAQYAGLQKTLQAGQEAVALLTELARPTATLAPSPTSAPSATPRPSSTPTATLAPSPATTLEVTSSLSVTASPSVTATPSRCDAADFVTDVTVPDNTVISPGETFTKTWRVRNSGFCDWSADYALVFSSGDQMGAPDEIALPQVVLAGETVDISLELTAPTQPGTYTGFWALRNNDGTLFGMGQTAAMAFWVQIQVPAAETPEPY